MPIPGAVSSTVGAGSWSTDNYCGITTAGHPVRRDEAGRRLEVQLLYPVRRSEPPGPRVMGVCSRGQGLSVDRGKHGNYCRTPTLLTAIRTRRAETPATAGTALRPLSHLPLATGGAASGRERPVCDRGRDPPPWGLGGEAVGLLLAARDRSSLRPIALFGDGDERARELDSEATALNGREAG